MAKKKNELKEITLDELTNRKVASVDVEQLSDSTLLSLLTFQNLTNPQNLKTNSRIKMEQVDLLTKLKLFSMEFDIDFTNIMADTILELQVSVNGLGRRELVEASKTVITGGNDFTGDSDFPLMKDKYK